MAGQYHKAGAPDVAGYFYTWGSKNMTFSPPFALSEQHDFSTVLSTPPGDTDGWMGIDFSLSSSQPTYGKSSTVMPESVDVTMALYLGMTA